MRRFGPLDGLVAGWVLALLLYALALGGWASGRMGVDGAFGLSALAFVLGLLCLVMFVWAMLIDCLNRPFDPGDVRRAIYVGLIVFLVPLGALFYYWSVVRPAASKRKEAE